MKGSRLTAARIRRRWQAWRVAEAVAIAHGHPRRPQLRAVRLRLRNRRYSLWQLELEADGSPLPPVILKVLSHHRRNRVERELWCKGRRLLAPVLPILYGCHTLDGHTWLFQQQVLPLAGRIALRPATFAQILPAVATLHALAWRMGPGPAPTPWLPNCSDGPYAGPRAYARTRAYIERALRRQDLRRLLKPYRGLLMALLDGGSGLFGELAATVWSIVHGDLHMHNVCCNDLGSRRWDVRFIDWQTARFAPVWFDLVVLVELLIDFRRDWWPEAADIRRQAFEHYRRALEERGLELSGDPWRLYRLAYLQRTLEIGLRTQLRRALDGRDSPLLERYLHKLADWSRELQLV